MGEKVSIIIPVYNVEKYLTVCLESIINQTYKNWEVILVDDGSSDRSGIICDQYVEKHMGFQVYHQNNQGVSNARNRGLLLASGDYISFIDPDDYLDCNTYSTMISLMEKTNVDISFFQFIWFDDGTLAKQSVDSSENNIHILKSEDRVNIPLRYSGSSCNCIYDATLIKEQKFSENYKLAEDTLFLVEALLKSKSTLFLNQGFYYRRRRPSSACTSVYNSDWMKLIDVATDIKDLLIQSSRTYTNIANYEFWFKVYDLISKLSNDYKQNSRDVCHIQKLVRNSYWGMAKSPYVPMQGKLALAIFCISPKLFYKIKNIKGTIKGNGLA